MASARRLLVLVGTEFWRPLLDFLKNTLVAQGTIGPDNLKRITVTDSADEVASCIKELAMRQFGLTCGPRLVAK